MDDLLFSKNGTESKDSNIFKDSLINTKQTIKQELQNIGYRN